MFRTSIKKMKTTILLRIAFLFVLIWLLSCDKTKNEENQLDPAVSKAYSDILKMGLDREFPGIILGIQCADDPIWIGAGGISSLEDNTEMRSDDRFHIASVTKLFTSIVTLQLIDDKYFKFNTLAIKHLDTAMVNSIPNIEKITIGQLLDHSSGIYSFNNDLDYLNTLIGSQANSNIRWTNDELLKLASGERVNPEGVPGSGHYYSDANPILLAEIVANVTGKSFREVVYEKIIKPLALQNTGFYEERIDPEHFGMNTTVQGYMVRSEVIDDFIELHPSFNEILLDSITLLNTTKAAEKTDSAAGIVSTAEDLVRVGQALYKEDLVSQESLSWLYGIGEGLENEEIHSTRQGIVTARNKSYGILYTSLGDGPAGINTMLAYHPESETIIVSYTNVFGYFYEHDFFIDEIVPKILEQNE